MFREEPQYTEVNPGANAELRCVIENIGGECRWQKDGKVSLKFMFSKKATKIYEMFTVDLTLCSKRQIDGEDFFQFSWPS